MVFFSSNFFQGHNWLTNYLDSEFHGHWKTVTLSSISPNLSKHWRFLAFRLSLCFGSCLLFLVCHYKAFLFSTRAMTTFGWLPNAPNEGKPWVVVLTQGTVSLFVPRRRCVVALAWYNPPRNLGIVSRWIVLITMAYIFSHLELYKSLRLISFKRPW